MKYFLLATIIFSSLVFANTKDLLQGVNPRWENYKEAYSPKYTNTPLSEKELVKLHLLNAIDFISERTESLDLSLSELEARNKNLQTLSQYAERENFPINNIQSERTPIFVDHLGTHCAVGYLLKQDKESEIINFVKSSNNLIKILEIDNQDFNTWQAQSGFTMDELALIQPGYGEPYRYYRSEKTIDKDAIINGSLQINNKYYVYGNIKSIEGVAVDNIAVLHQGNWSNFGNGISGEIKGILDYEFESVNAIFACGNDILPTGFKNDIAVYNENNGWMPIGIMTDGVVNQMTKKGNKIYVIGDFTQVNGKESHNIFSFDSQTYEIQGFGKQFEDGITKITDPLDRELCVLSKGTIFILIDNQFESLEITNLDNTKFIDFEFEHFEDIWAVTDENMLALLNPISSKGFFLSYRIPDLHVSELLSDNYLGKKSVFVYHGDDSRNTITKASMFRIISESSHEFSVVSGYKHNFFISTYNGEIVHLFSNKEGKETNYEELKLQSNSLPIELDKFIVHTIGNSINYEIASDKLTNAKIELVNLQGEILASRKLARNKEIGQFQVNQNGLYLLNVSFDNKVVTKKVIVTN